MATFLDPNLVAEIARARTFIWDSTCNILNPGQGPDGYGGTNLTAETFGGVNTTVSAGANSATQTVASTTGMEPGMSFYFEVAQVHAAVEAVTDSTHVVFAVAVNSTTGEALVQDLNCLVREKRRLPTESLAGGAPTARKLFEVVLPLGSVVGVSSRLTVTGPTGIKETYEVNSHNTGRSNALEVVCDCVRINDGTA